MHNVGNETQSFVTWQYTLLYVLTLSLYSLANGDLQGPVYENRIHLLHGVGDNAESIGDHGLDALSNGEETLPGKGHAGLRGIPVIRLLHG